MSLRMSAEPLLQCPSLSFDCSAFGGAFLLKKLIHWLVLCDLLGISSFEFPCRISDPGALEVVVFRALTGVPTGKPPDPAASKACRNVAGGYGRMQL